MSPDQANTIRNRIELYDKTASRVHRLQEFINSVWLHEDKTLKLGFVGLSLELEIPKEIKALVVEYLIDQTKVVQDKLNFELGEIVSPAGTVSHE